jgi:hypothetical protein
MSEKDVTLNNLHSIVGEAEWEMVSRLLHGKIIQATEVTKEMEIPEKYIGIKVTIEVWQLDEPA